MSTTLAKISKELNIPKDELTKKSLLTFLEYELRLAEEDIAVIHDKYLVSSRSELEENIKNKKIYSHPAREDLIAWENLEKHISKIKKMIQIIK